MKLGLIVQRYGVDISGGAELHARLIAEKLSRFHEIEAFTTCAKDYVTWKNEFKSGVEWVNGIPVNRFKVDYPRNMRRFFDIQNLVFQESQAIKIEEKWISENGPISTGLIKAVEKRQDIDAWILFSYRYWTTVHSLRILKQKAILVPTAEHDPAIHLGVFKSLFHIPGATAYNSLEERNLIWDISGARDVPNEIVGVGLEDIAPEEIVPYHSKFLSRKPYLIYVGRIDKNKGCDHLFRMFKRYHQEKRGDIELLLIGQPVLDIPKHPAIVHLGRLGPGEKICAIRHARCLVMPSPYESLSMVVLEAWRESRPVVANEKCEVLKGQCARSNGGLTYLNYDEFAHIVDLFMEKPEIAGKIGRNGHSYFLENYTWDTIMKKYDNLLEYIRKRCR